MPIFVSYSHADKEFARKLAAQLVQHKAHIWIDEWEMHVGDSLIEKVQGAIQGATALLVLLSRHSVDSEWCKKELSAGLIRELEEKRVVVLPVLIEDCQIPMFLRDKVYADFRTDFDAGLNAVLDGIAKVTSQHLARVETAEYLTDWAIDVMANDGEFRIVLTAVDRPASQPYSVLLIARITGNETANRRYAALQEVGLEHIEVQSILYAAREAISTRDLRILLEDEHEVHLSIQVNDTRSPAIITTDVSCRRLGQDTGRDIIFDVGKQLGELLKELVGRARGMNPDEVARLRAVQSRFEKTPSTT